MVRLTHVLLAAALVSVPASVAHANDDAPTLEAYGFIKPSVVGTFGRPSSLGRNSAVAITNAGNPALTDADNSLSFQVQQTRLGVRIRPAEGVSGQLEIDFVNFDNATPTVQSRPRLRIAEVKWQASESVRVSFGQGWEAFAPMNPHHHNFVGTYFRSGNTGFMRQQLAIYFGVGGSEIGLVAGMAGINAGPNFGRWEDGVIPSGTLRATFDIGAGTLGVAAFAASVDNPGADAQVAAGGSVWTSVDIGDDGQLRAEAVVGQGLASTGMITVGDVTPTDAVPELNMFVSFQQRIAKHGVHVGAGISRVLDTEVAPLAITLGDDGSLTPGGGTGIEQSISVRGGWFVRPVAPLELFVDVFGVQTAHLVPEGSGIDGDGSVAGAEAGMVLRF